MWQRHAGARAAAAARRRPGGKERRLSLMFSPWSTAFPGVNFFRSTTMYWLLYVPLFSRATTRVHSSPAGSAFSSVSALWGAAEPRQLGARLACTRARPVARAHAPLVASALARRTRCQASSERWSMRENRSLFKTDWRLHAVWNG